MRAVGLAGASSGETPAWMDARLAPALAWLKSLEAAVCHDKVCSTFDPSPEIGSIGRAVDIGQKLFSQAKIPHVVGAPQLTRYAAFGNLFAAYLGVAYRIDRRPVMSRHPVTPMLEANIRLHPARLTEKKTMLIDLAMLHRADIDALADAIVSNHAECAQFDVADLETQRIVGRLIWRMHSDRGVFIVGSSGVEYALLAE